MACTKCKKKKASEDVVSIESTREIISSKFKLKGIVGMIQMSFGSGQFISNMNLTDSLALEFLRANPNRISMFEIFPEDWKLMISEQNNDEKVVIGTNED